MFTSQDVQSRLTQFYQTALADAFVKVSDVESVSGGWEAWLYKFTLHTRDATQSLILRLFHGQNDQKAQHEFKAMRGLKRLNYPVPSVYHLTLFGDSLFEGSHFMMDFVEGRRLAQVMGEGDTIDVGLLTRYCQLMADLHDLAWGSEFTPDFAADDPYGPVEHFLGLAYQVIQQEVFADLAPLVDWIRSRRDDIPCPRLSLTHNDFHPDNVLIKDDGELIVIDWPSMQITDYRNDLAWLLLLEGTYVSRAASDAILRTYEAVRSVNVENVEIFIVMAAARRLSDLVQVINGEAAKHGLRPDLSQSMRRDADHFRACYAWLVEITSIRLEVLESLLATLDE